jgi:DNA-binding response OmpR family regulator
MENKRVLIIDDEVDICRLLSNLIKKEGLQTNYAHSLANGKNKIVDFYPHIIFLDLNLPDGIGFSIIPFIRERLPDAKIIIISAYDSTKEKEYAKNEMKIDHFISKPLNRKLILETIASIK